MYQNKIPQRQAKSNEPYEAKGGASPPVCTQRESKGLGGEWAPPLGERYLLQLCEDTFFFEGEDTPELPGDPEGNQLRDAWFRQAQHLNLDGDEFHWFLQVCSEAIKRLHRNGHLVDYIGKVVPVGIAVGNDEPRIFTAEITKKSNPDNLSKGMEDWLILN